VLPKLCWRDRQFYKSSGVKFSEDPECQKLLKSAISTKLLRGHFDSDTMKLLHDRQVVVMIRDVPDIWFRLAGYPAIF